MGVWMDGWTDEQIDSLSSLIYLIKVAVIIDVHICFDTWYE